MSDGGVPRAEGASVPRGFGAGRERNKARQGLVGGEGLDRLVHGAYVAGAFDQGDGAPPVIESNPRANSVAKSDIPSDQFGKVEDLFVNHESENLEFQSNITEDQINQCDVPERLKAFLRQALNGSRPGAKVDSTW